MGQEQSKDKLLFELVNLGDTEAIKTLHRVGAGLEWRNYEGKTPLILASMNAELFNVAKTLIDLGSDVNAYRSGWKAGTPLHHAAERGLVNTVKLLLSHQAYPLIVNDSRQTPLGIARTKDFCNVVRAIESHICLFSGWMREFYRPSFLGLFTSQLSSRRVWVVIVPSQSSELEVAVYDSLQDAQPRTVMALRRAKVTEPKSDQSDSSVTIVNDFEETRLTLAAAIEGDRQQLNWFCDACKGIPQISNITIDQAGPSTSTSISPHLPGKVSSVDFIVEEPSAPPLPEDITVEDGLVFYPSNDSILPSLDCENQQDKGSGVC